MVGRDRGMSDFPTAVGILCGWRSASVSYLNTPWVLESQPCTTGVLSTSGRHRRLLHSINAEISFKASPCTMDVICGIARGVRLNVQELHDEARPLNSIRVW